MWPAIIGAIGAIGGSIISGAMQNSANEKAYAQSLEGMREQNQFNAEEAEKNRQFQSNEAAINRQFQRQMELDSRFYNNAHNQVARLRAAGINPYLADVTAGQGESLAGAQASGAQASGSAAPVKTPVDYSSIVNQGFANVVNTLSAQAAINESNQKSELLRQQGINQGIINETENTTRVMNIVRTMAEIEQAKESTKTTSSQRKVLDITHRKLAKELERISATFDEDVQRPAIENDLMSSQAEYNRCSAALQKSGVRVNAAKVAELYQAIQESRERISKMAVERKLTNQEIRVKINEQAKLIAETVGIDNQNKNYGLFLDKVRSEIAKNNRFEIGGVPFIYSPDDGTAHRPLFDAPWD